MNILDFYNHQCENAWYQFWLDHKLFSPHEDSSKEPYSIVIPPPNVTGILHMGHCLNNTIQDILIRHAKQQDKNICWVPGTDHASIATEAKVVAMLKEKNILKESLSREEFLKYAFEWKEKYGNIILDQLKKLGCALDWNKTDFTMNPTYSKMVLKVFETLYNEGYVYQDHRMIHWDTEAQTALSDEEVYHKEVEDKLYFIRYEIVGHPNEFITIATVRPETIMGDVAICVHPTDPRYVDFHHKEVIIPLINKKIPIIADEYVDIEFGTGALKITPAHDPNDFVLGKKHNLEFVDIFNKNGTLNDHAQIGIGLNRFEARKWIVNALKDHIVKIENYAHQVGFSERTHSVVEPRLSKQWFLKMKELSLPAIEVVQNKKIKFYPEKFINTYNYWLENVRDWCISRQLWWGHRIPAWYDENGTCYVGSDLETVHEKFPETKVKKLIQDPDCLDTWFSSWLWPLEVFKGLSEPQNSDFKKFYPTTVLVTAPEILFFWVARMIIAGLKFKNEIPFKNVYLTGIVRDHQGRKMSKSLGNSPDLLKLIDEYGADSVRFGIMIASPAGNDLLFDSHSIQQGKEFINKLWNVLKLILKWHQHASQTTESNVENNIQLWFDNSWHKKKLEIDLNYSQYKLSDNLKLIYSFIWNEFCSQYLEWLKPSSNENMSIITLKKVITNFQILLGSLHPYMPFITEEINLTLHNLFEHNKENYSSILSHPKKSNIINPVSYIIDHFNLINHITIQIRSIRQQQQIKFSEILNFGYVKSDFLTIKPLFPLLEKMNHLQPISLQPITELELSNSNFSGSMFKFTYENHSFYIISSKKADTSASKNKLIEELTYQEKFLLSIKSKLVNNNFISKAKPEVIELEQKKLKDTEQRIEAIKSSLQGL